MKKRLLYMIHIMMVFTLLVSIKIVEAIDFENQENKYMSICSSQQLSKYQSECRQFNEYLKKKNKNLKENIKDVEKNITQTKSDIKNIENKMNQLNKQINDSNQNIADLEDSIKALKQSILDKENEMKERMYAMQTYTNNQRFIEYIFSADSFTDFFSRTQSIQDLTEYDNELINQLSHEKDMFHQQKEALAVVKENIELQKKHQETLQVQYNQLLKEQSQNLIDSKKEQEKVSQSQGRLDTALSQLVTQTQSSSSGVSGDSKLGQAIANKALSKQGCMYLWGAGHTMSEIMNPHTSRFDCSGLVSWAYYQAGCSIGINTTKTLLNKGIAISAKQLQAGDIILFKNSSGVVSHVGIAINHSQMVHAPETGKAVQVADLTQGWRSRVISYRRLY